VEQDLYVFIWLELETMCVHLFILKIVNNCVIKAVHSFIHQGRRLAIGSLSTCLSAYRQCWGL